MPVNYRIMVGNDAIAREFGGIASLPSTFLIDRSGRVVESHEGIVGRVDMENRLKNLLTAH